MPRSMPGQGCVITSQPPWFWPTGLPAGSTIAGMMPGSGLVQLPGLVAIAPGSGLIMMPPVSVCHQVSTIGQRSPPIMRWYHIHASGLMPSPTVPKQPQARQVVLLDVLVAPLDERANRGRGRVEDRDFVLFDELPEAAFVRIVRRAFVHQHRRAGRERAVDDVAVAGDPADVGRAPEDVVVAMVEHPLERFLDEQVVAGRRVLDALGFAGRAAGVEDEQRRFAVHRRGRAIGRRLLHQLVPPEVAAGLHVHLGATGSASAPDATQHDALFDGRTLGERLVDRLLERQHLAAPPAAVGRDLQLGAGVAVALGDRLGREAGEDHRVDRADPRTGQHRDRQLRHHRHVDRHAVARLDAEVLEHVRELAHFAVQLGIRERARVARLAFPENRRAVAQPAARLRSRQLYETFVLPPTNHWANGSFHTSGFSNGWNQCSSSRASSAQNFGGSAAAWSHSC